MPRLSPLLVAFFVLAGPLLAQPLPDVGPSVKVGSASGEALAIHLTDGIRGGYRFDSGLGLGATVALSRSTGFSPDFHPSGEVLATEREIVRHDVGMDIEKTFEAGGLAVRLGGLAAYRYRYSRSTGYVLMRDFDPRNPDSDSISVLRPDSRYDSRRRGQSLAASASVAVSRTLIASQRGWLAPGLGVSVGSNEVLGSNTTESALSYVAYVNVPARVAATDRVGVTLDATVGVEGRRVPSFLSAITGQRWDMAPAVSGSIQLDF